MKRILLLFTIGLIGLQSCNNAQGAEKKTEVASTTYYLVRHAEKDLNDPNTANPQLTPEGVVRAMNYAEYFKDKGIDAVYSTDYIRTQETARPTAEMAGVPVLSYDPNSGKIDGIPMGQNVLIVGHSNTIPQLANSLAEVNTYTELDEATEYGTMFIITRNEDGTIQHRVEKND